jgi:hypothetical protein
MDPFEKIYRVEFFDTSFGFSPGKSCVRQPRARRRRKLARKGIQSTPVPGPVHNSAAGVAQPMITRVHRAQGISDNRDPEETNASPIPDAAATPAQANIPHPLAS